MRESSAASNPVTEASGGGGRGKRKPKRADSVVQHEPVSAAAAVSSVQLPTSGPGEAAMNDRAGCEKVMKGESATTDDGGRDVRGKAESRKRKAGSARQCARRTAREPRSNNAKM